MKSKTVYTCDYCEFESVNPIEVETHEATHIGNGLTLSEYQHYKKLQENAYHTSVTVSLRNNNETRKNWDKAIDSLIEFEEKHGISEGYRIYKYIPRKDEVK